MFTRDPDDGAQRVGWSQDWKDENVNRVLLCTIAQLRSTLIKTGFNSVHYITIEMLLSRIVIRCMSLVIPVRRNDRYAKIQLRQANHSSLYWPTNLETSPITPSTNDAIARDTIDHTPIIRGSYVVLISISVGSSMRSRVLCFLDWWTIDLRSTYKVHLIPTPAWTLVSSTNSLTSSTLL